MFVHLVAEECLAWNSLTDLILTFLPYFMLKDLNMEFRNKIALSLLMGLSIFAMVACVVKTFELKVLDSRNDFTRHAAGFVVWSTVENYVVIVAASIPTLRPLALTLCQAIRINASRHDCGTSGQTPPPAYQQDNSWGSRAARPRPVRLSSNRQNARLEVEPPYVHPEQHSPPPPGTIRKTISIYVRSDDECDDIELEHLGGGVLTRISAGGRGRDTTGYDDGWMRAGTEGRDGRAGGQLPAEGDSRRRLLEAKTDEDNSQGDRDVERQ